MMNLFHKHNYPRTNAVVGNIEKDDEGHTFLVGTVTREVQVGDDWTCDCGKQFYVFTLKHNAKGQEIPDWREVGKFK